MLNKFTRKHIGQMLGLFEEELHKKSGFVPLDRFTRNYFSENQSLGSHDRQIISDLAFKIVRWRSFLDVISPKPLSWEGRLDTLLKPDFENQKKNPSLKRLYDLLKENYGQDRAFEIANWFNERGPLTVRVNPLKISREQLLQKWQKADKMGVRACDYSPLGIIFTTNKNQNLYEMPEYRRGLFEIQDEGSQLAALRLKCEPTNKVLDFCAGSGGQTLAFAPFLQGTGQIYLYDTRNSSLIEAKKRLSRAGIENSQVHSSLEPLKNMRGKFDWIFLDAPCTGTGTYRRNPDAKYRFSTEQLNHMVELQRGVFQQALPYLNMDKGRIVYTTCSLLPQGGQHIEIMPPVTASGEKHTCDSFFSATLQLSGSQ